MDVLSVSGSVGGLFMEYKHKEYDKFIQDIIYNRGQ